MEVNKNLTSAKINKKPLSMQMELGLAAFIFVSIALICILSVLFLAHSNRVANNGVEFSDLRAKYKVLQQENEIMSMKIADLEALDRLEDSEIIKNMVKADKPLYIRGDTAVAQNR